MGGGQPAYDVSSRVTSFLGEADANWYDFNVTEMCSEWMTDPEHNYGIMLINPNSNSPECYVSWKIFTSSDNTLYEAPVPKMTIHYAAAPEPSSFVLWTAGIFILACRRKKRPAKTRRLIR